MVHFSAEQEASIERKVKLFSPILEKGLSQEEWMRRVGEIGETITRKRLEWYEKNKDQLDSLMAKEVTDVQKAVVLLFGYQMDIRDGLTIVPFLDMDMAVFSVDILSRNFCPYLEAFKRMGIKSEDSVRLCELALERPCQALIERLNPNIRFFRDYSHIRPIADYCCEHMIIRAPLDSGWKKLLNEYVKEVCQFAERVWRR